MRDCIHAIPAASYKSGISFFALLQLPVAAGTGTAGVITGGNQKTNA